MSEIRQAWALLTLNQWDWQGTVQTCPRFLDSLAHLADVWGSFHGQEAGNQLGGGLQGHSAFPSQIGWVIHMAQVWLRGHPSVLFLKGCGVVQAVEKRMHQVIEVRVSPLTALPWRLLVYCKWCRSRLSLGKLRRVKCMEGQRRGFITPLLKKLSGHPNFGDLSGENQDRYTL